MILTALSLWLALDSPYKFSVQFRQAENYPVDLYYVMDMSNSMKDDKERLALLGDLLGECKVRKYCIDIFGNYTVIINAARIVCRAGSL